TDSTTPPPCPRLLLSHTARKMPPQASASSRARRPRKDCDEQPSPAASTLDGEDDDVSWGSWDDQEDPDERDIGGGRCNDADDGRGSRGSASAPPRHGTIRVETGGNGEDGNEHVEARSPGGPTEDPRKRDGPVRDDLTPARRP
ncbi:hypothetical protein THAOC_31243, partial [Thalassiosira oceanica]